MSTAPNFQKSIQSRGLKATSVGTIRNDILSLVGTGQYTHAVQLLKDFSNSEFPYPNFKLKTERYVKHSIDLVLAIEANRNFLSLGSLTKPKQHELKEKFKKHFEDLKNVLEKIEVSYEELKDKDNKSTKYLVRAVWAALVIVTVNALMLDIFSGLAETVYNLIENSLTYFSDVVSKLM